MGQSVAPGSTTGLLPENETGSAPALNM